MWASSRLGSSVAEIAACLAVEVSAARPDITTQASTTAQRNGKADFMSELGGKKRGNSGNALQWARQEDSPRQAKRVFARWRSPMSGYFSIGDWIVIVAYLSGIIGLGMWFGKDQRNTRDYFLGSRNIPWWGIGVSIVAAETSALTVIGVPAYAYGGNMMFIQMIVGYVIARIILAVVMVPHYLSGEIYSPYQLLEQHLGR